MSLPMTLHRPWPTLAGSDGVDGDTVVLTPEDAGWTWCGLRVLTLQPETEWVVPTGGSEVFVLPLAGSVRMSVAQPGAAPVTYELAGRDSVFSGVTDFAYAGRDSVVTLISPGGAEVALPSARCPDRLPAAYGPASRVPIEVRGAGPCTRQVNGFGVPGAWSHASKLMACEVLTPPGNWSSYPPHKHDPTRPCPVANEEIYYYRIAGRDQVTPDRCGFGVHHTHTGPEHSAAGLPTLDLRARVRDHDVVLVPYGYHGPCVAAPGYPMYYLNVLAGPAPDRSMAFRDDPEHAWVRGTWQDGAPDPRVPLTPTHAGHRSDA
jgi:5-deoxy-glucuronate isomerase